MPVTFTPGVQPQAAAPALLNASDGTISCLVAGNTYPATALVFTVNGGSPFTVPFSPEEVFNLSLTSTTTSDSINVVASQQTTGPINVTASAHGGTPSGGVF